MGFAEEMEQVAEEVEQEVEQEVHNNYYQNFYFKKKKGIGKILFGLFVFLFGVIWLGNELEWWEITFPLIPALIILFGTSILYGAIRDQLSKN